MPSLGPGEKDTAKWDTIRSSNSNAEKEDSRLNEPEAKQVLDIIIQRSLIGK